MDQWMISAEEGVLFECCIAEERGMVCLRLIGRIDSLSSPEIKNQLSEMIMQGHRSILLSLEQVIYMSSAGLRVFIEAEKQMQSAGGEIVLYKPTPNMNELLQLSCFDQIFKIIHNEDELAEMLGSAIKPTSSSIECGNIVFGHIHREAQPGTLKSIGSQNQLSSSSYTEADVVSIPARDIVFGTGLATLGDEYKDYCHYFGEALVINRHLFFYPAVKRPAVDMMFCMGEQSNLEYKFLNGFGYNGEFAHRLSFEAKEGFVEISELIDSLFQVSSASTLGVVLLAESKGFWGMNLRKVPILENQPANGKDIFDTIHFADWVNFPIEPADVNHVVAAVGIAVRDQNAAPSEVQNLIPGDSRFHLHAAVFNKGPLNRQADQFEDELKRVLTEMEAIKVQHVIGKTQFSSGLVGLIEIGS